LQFVATAPSAVAAFSVTNQINDMAVRDTSRLFGL